MRMAGRAIALALLAAGPAGAQGVSFDQYKSLPVTAGSWQYRALPDGSEARFGELFALRCHRPSRQITVSRIGLAASGPMTILTSSAQKTLSAGSMVPARDPFFDSMAFSRGRFIVSVGSLLPLLAVPSWPEAARSIEDCRI